MSARGVTVSQPLSPLFRLPAELRLEIYDYLAFPPIDSKQCHGLILSCRKAKQECEEVAIKASKAWMTRYKQAITPYCAFNVRILIPHVPPIGSSFRLNTIREITLVLRGDMLYVPSWPSPPFFKELRCMVPIFDLWLDKVTLHFIGPPGGGTEKRYRPRCLGPSAEGAEKRTREKIFDRLQFILEGGLMHAHDPVGQAREKEIRKYSEMWNYWRPKPTFIKKLVLSWDLTEQGLSSDEFVGLGGVCKEHPVRENHGRRMYKVVDGKSGLLGEYMLESFCHFKPTNEQDRPHSHPGRKVECFKCNERRDYRRYMRGLPAATDERWI
ncbi:hypothetical protein CC86DRAFT_23027 [Ophiobolus disseminans]|uniref:Uncharacterized protein n=1 Tax=Ophiobolus disseminans TaxID=1469910 RepID=A0A6A7A2K7_9PLEO|nr:hypothetical protein CC86DRAFT_23027 [Ophiobolus disseminans]